MLRKMTRGEARQSLLLLLLLAVQQQQFSQERAKGRNLWTDQGREREFSVAVQCSAVQSMVWCGVVGKRDEVINL